VGGRAALTAGGISPTPVVHQVETEWEAHLGNARTRQLRHILAALREVTDRYS
jgi:hypothetical protein